MRFLFVLLFTSVIAYFNVRGQTMVSDSVKKVLTAKRDATPFRLKRAEMRLFFSEHFSSSSDYFKPTKRYTQTDSLLSDSVYVKAFRIAAAYNVAGAPPPMDIKSVLRPGSHVARPGSIAYKTRPQQAAQNDATHFRLTKALLARFKAEHFPNTSDYFKPAEGDAKDPAFLTDSGYVQTFRFEAYRQAQRQPLHPVRHVLVIVVPIVVGVAAAVGLTIALFEAFGHATNSIYSNIH